VRCIPVRPQLLAACLAVIVCLGGTASAQVLLRGAGSTFGYPIYAKWFEALHALHPELQISYQAIGSGGGIGQFLEGRVDFGASDGPMTDDQLAQAKVPVLHLPTVLGADVVIWNLPGWNLPQNALRFTPEVLAGIFRGSIRHWDSPALAALNPDVKFPDAEIVVVHRSDGSGTTYVWTDYLSKVSPEWAQSVGKGTSVDWPIGLGGKGNDGVAELVQETPNSIGYVELIYAKQAKLPHGFVRNRTGNFLQASLDSITAAASSAAGSMPADFRVSITDGEAPNGYPISSFTWFLIPARIADAEKGRAITAMLKWVLDDGQRLAPSLLYAPLPPRVIELERPAIDRILVGAG
jgi:phosphate transport system substrate-binding protein